MNEETQDRETLDLPSQPGTYALLLEATGVQDVPIGKLGVLHLLPGIYVYLGSALGPGGLAARVGRHALREKVLHWHIDYLRAETRLVAVWYARSETSGMPLVEDNRTGGQSRDSAGWIRSVGLPMPVASAIFCESPIGRIRSTPAKMPGDTLCPRLSRRATIAAVAADRPRPSDETRRSVSRSSAGPTPAR